MLRRGDIVTVRAKKSDGTVYRWWRARVESSHGDRIVTVSRVGDAVKGPAGGWSMKHAQRTIYWFDRPYNLTEMYEKDGRLKQVYVHIATPAQIQGTTIEYTDLELDVVRRPGQPVRVVDEDEFCAACTEYGYTDEFQVSCRQAVNRAVELARTWRAGGPPAIARRDPEPVRSGEPGRQPSHG